MTKIVIPKNQRFLMDCDNTYNEAVTLAIYMNQTFYPENKEFHLCDSTAGIISQIDNMVTGLKRVQESSMESQKILDAMEEGIIKAIRSGEPFTIPYGAKVDVSDQIKQAYKNIDFTRVQAQITQHLEEELARKIVNKVITEMGTDIKKLMSNASIRDDFRFLLRKGVEELLGRVVEDSNEEEVP